jgi:PKD repeat protein
MRVGLAAVACCLLILAGCSSGSSSGGSASTGSSGGSTLKAPTAQPGGTYAGTVGAPLTFNGSGSTDPQNQTLSYAWNFGDNATSAGPDPTHTYTATGIFTVTLTVTDTGGLSGTATTQASIGQPGPVGLTGTVSNGVLPIVGAHVYLFAANTTGYGQASISLLTAAKTGTSDAVGAYVLSSASGGFSMTGDYSCTSGQQLYLYALGGTAGGNTNLNAGLLAAIGNCTGAGSVVYAVVNEVSTVAAAYAIAGFAVDATHVSSSGTALAQAGIASAFANAANLATLSTGIALPTAPGSNATVPRLEINALANILGSCVVTGTSCNTLLPLAANGGTIPTDTATAAIDIAHNPGANTATLFGLGASQVFTPALSGAPNDFTLALVYSDYNLAYGYSLAIHYRVLQLGNLPVQRQRIG